MIFSRIYILLYLFLITVSFVTGEVGIAALIKILRLLGNRNYYGPTGTGIFPFKEKPGMCEGPTLTPVLSDYCRIIGGTPTDTTRHPHQVALEHEFWGKHIQMCGGSIISNYYVLTAAHCFDYNVPVRVRSGTPNRENGGTVHQVTNLIIHEGYSENGNANDIALLQVGTPFQFNTNVQAIPIAHNTPQPNSAVEATGWGHTSEGGDFSPILLEVTLYTVDRPTCQQRLSIKDGMLCAGVYEGGKDTCQGDSGGPLIFQGQLVGITSWGPGCGRPGTYGVYTDVACFRNWVSKHLQNNNNWNRSFISNLTSPDNEVNDSSSY